MSKIYRQNNVTTNKKFNEYEANSKQQMQNYQQYQPNSSNNDLCNQPYQSTSSSNDLSSLAWLSSVDIQVVLYVITTSIKITYSKLGYQLSF